MVRCAFQTQYNYMHKTLLFYRNIIMILSIYKCRYRLLLLVNQLFGLDLRKYEGVIPVSFLKAELKDEIFLYPTVFAIPSIL